MNKILTTITTLIFGLATSTTAQYVHPWPMENVQVQQEHNINSKDEDTLTWETIADIEFVYAKAVGNADARYTLDIELLDNGGFLVPWCDFDNGFYITELDSNANEVYTNHYPGYFSVKLDLYREGNMLYMLGKYRDGEEAESPYYAALIKYDLVNRDTVFSKKVIRLPDYSADPCRSEIGADSVFYFVSGFYGGDDNLYLINKQGVLIDSIVVDIELRSVHNIENDIIVFSREGEMYKVTSTGLEFISYLTQNNFSSSYFAKNNLYTLEWNGGYVFANKYNQNNDLIYSATSNDFIFGDKTSDRGFHLQPNNCMLLANCINVSEWWPPEETVNYTLSKLSPNGVWLHKLIINGINLRDSYINCLPNGDYILVANADENPNAEGTIFFTRIKPWNDSITAVQQLPLNEGDLSFYPNPSNDFINIQLPDYSNGSLNIFNLQGESCYQQFVMDHQTSVRINLNYLPTGVYFIKYFSPEKVLTGKLLKR